MNSFGEKILSRRRDRWKPVWDIVEWPLLLPVTLMIFISVTGCAVHHSRQ